MASDSMRRSCYKCPKGFGNISCAGCQRWMCKQHFNEHQNELSSEMDGLCQEFDRFHDDVSKEDQSKSMFFSQIDRWERKSIEKIRQTAKQIRDEVQQYLDDRRNRLKLSLNQISDALRAGRAADDFTEIELKNWTDELEKLRKNFVEPAKIRILNENRDASQSIRLIKLKKSFERNFSLNFNEKTCWTKFGVTIAGNNSLGNALNQLNSPYAVTIDTDDENLFIADYENDRIVLWGKSSTCGEILVGKCRNDQLNGPAALLIDDETGDLIVSELRSRRITRWTLSNVNRCEILVSNIRCYGLAMDDEKNLYVSDCEKHEVRRYRKGETKGVVVAGGHGLGNRFDQLNCPRNIFVDRQRSIFISDSNNHRVVRWIQNVNEEKLVVSGEIFADVANPRGLFVDENGSLFVVDQLAHRILRFMKNSTESTTIIGGNGQGTRQMNLSHPMDFCFDHQGQIYVADFHNHRIQRFSID